jgi:hypothetical protein
MTDDVAPGLAVHVSSGEVDLWRTALRYAHNFVTASGGERQVDIVVNGAAVDLVLTGSPVLALLQDVLDCGAVELGVCANTMAARGIGTGDLHSATTVVAAAVLHVAQRQWAGWAYLRP